MRVMTWNVRSLRDDHDALESVIRTAHPDVLALQEAPRFWRSRTKLAALARRTGLLFACGGRASAGTALLTSLQMDVLRTSEALLPRTPGLHRRGVALAEIRPSGTNTHLAVACVHLGLRAAERRQHAQRINDLVAGVGRPLSIVAGDLNEAPQAPAARLLAAGRRDPGAVADEPTFPAKAPRHRIDVVLVPGSLAATAQVLGGEQVARATDHRPVVVDLHLT